MLPRDADLAELPEDSESLRAVVRSLLQERDAAKRRGDEQEQRAEGQQKRADDLHIEMLRLQLELDRYKKWYYGPRADRLQSSGDLAQMLLNFAEEMERKPVNPDDLPSHGESAEGLRRVKRRKGRRNLATFENLPVTTYVHELDEQERSHFERIHHLRKKYACPGCESNGDNPQMETAAKPETAIDKGLAGPGLLAYIVTSKFSDYLPLYRLEDIFARQGFEISRATQSVWCGDVADLIEPLYAFMADGVRDSHVVSTDDTIMLMLKPGKVANARMWVYVGDDAHRSSPAAQTHMM